MIQKLNIDNDQYLVYKISIIDINRPFVVFAHGLLSDMHGKKAMYLEEYCQNAGYNFIRFDNLGHGKSSIKFLHSNINSWLKGLEHILTELVPNKAILVGSSMGGWISLLASGQMPNKIQGLITLAAAPDFTEEFWLNMSDQQKHDLENLGSIKFIGYNNISYQISYHQIIQARDHLLLNKEQIVINAPVHLIHGMQDNVVPYSVSLKLIDKITSLHSVTKLIKNADHRLSTDEDLKMIANSIEEIVDFTANGE